MKDHIGHYYQVVEKAITTLNRDPVKSRKKTRSLDT